MKRIRNSSRKMLMVAATVVMSGIVALVGVGTASASTVNPVIGSASYVLGQSDSGPYQLANVSGYSFTPRGTVFTEFQDMTTDPNNTSSFASASVTANIFGQISYTHFLGMGTSHLCHWLNAWAWDYHKGVWVSQAFFAHGPGC